MANPSLSISLSEPVVPAEWLHSNLQNPSVKVLDGSWYMPNENRNPLQEYQAARIPGAVFFDIDGILDIDNGLPHMLPSEQAFAAAVSALGISNQDVIVVYDGKGIFSAARVWCMFRVFGHDNVWVLDGGFPRWCALGFDHETILPEDAISKSHAASESTKKVYRGQLDGPFIFRTDFRSHLVWNLEKVQENINDGKYQHVDARSKDRFFGAAPEPRKGIKSGHIPGSKCVSFPQMLDHSQMLLSATELAKKFEVEGISLDRPIVVSCGTGVTACIVLLGLHRLGKRDVPLYDGSWTEWALHFGLTTDDAD